ncbi:hypothetical protein OF83DRAFT_1172675 [Amylostereum chailletii]|nr:hypothetical protein OF83DRAFT_1172675 [Amylostereum chailletii]
MSTMANQTLQTIALSGIIQDASGEDIPLKFHRVTPPAISVPASPVSIAGPQPFLYQLSAPPSDIPGSFHLSLQVSKRLGEGGISVVHAVTPILSDSSTSNYVSTADLPSLAAKIVHHPDARDRLDREAWFYEHMESLQGSVVPRCFGYFEAGLPKNIVFSPALRDTGYGRLMTKAKARDGQPDVRISLLLLEKLSGELLPVNVRYSEKEYRPLHDGVLNLYRELAFAGVEHWDYRRHNILKVLPVTAAREMPHTHATSEYRVIDFERAQRHNRDPVRFFNSCVGNDVMLLMRSLEENDPIGWSDYD